MKAILRWSAAGMLLACLACSVVLWAGCSNDPGQGKGADRKDSRIRALAMLYGQYLQANRAKTPPDEKTFKEFVEKTRPTARNLPEGTATLDLVTLFTSERDDQPFGILYGQAATAGPPTGPGGMRVVIYEQEGAGGRRFVGSAMGAIDDVDQARFAELVPQGG